MRQNVTVKDRFVRSAASHRRTAGFLPLPNLEILTIVLISGTALAISPIGRDIDRFFHVRVITRADGSYLFFHEVLDRLSSQRVVGVLMLMVALWCATRARSIAPLIIAGLAELMFAMTGVLKMGLAKSSTKLGDPDWWDGGILAQGKQSMAFPSGHATEAVLLWGTILLLLVLYVPRWRRRHTILAAQVWQLVIVNTVAVSWLMGRHWVSDLAAGLVCGLIGLRLVVGMIERGYPQAAADLCAPALARVHRVVSAPSTPASARPVMPNPDTYRTWLR